MYRMPTNPYAPSIESEQQGGYRMPTNMSSSTSYSHVLPESSQQQEYRMPNNPTVTNPDERTIGNSTNQATAIRIDDSSVDVRRTWSSAKIQEATQASEEQLVNQFVSNYGELYFSYYDETQYDNWTYVISDAVTTLSNGMQFYVAWSPNRSAQVIDADSDSEPRMTVIIDGRSYIMTDTNIQEVPLFNVVLQFQSAEAFPQVGDMNRLYIDLDEESMYYWNSSSGYVKLSGGSTAKMHKLTFGANQQYVYDGSKDVTVPVYMGQYN